MPRKVTPETVEMIVGRNPEIQLAVIAELHDRSIRAQEALKDSDGDAWYRGEKALCILEGSLKR